MSEQVKIGQLAEASAGRDAIHVAVAPVVAAEKLVPGQRIGFIVASREYVEAKIGAAVSHEVLGIVDPFLPTLVEEGERFYMWLLPGTTTGMRHLWSHPAFAQKGPQQ